MDIFYFLNNFVVNYEYQSKSIVRVSCTLRVLQDRLRHLQSSIKNRLFYWEAQLFNHIRFALADENIVKQFFRILIRVDRGVPATQQQQSLFGYSLPINDTDEAERKPDRNK